MPIFVQEVPIHCYREKGRCNPQLLQISLQCRGIWLMFLSSMSALLKEVGEQLFALGCWERVEPGWRSLLDFFLLLCRMSWSGDLRFSFNVSEWVELPDGDESSLVIAQPIYVFLSFLRSSLPKRLLCPRPQA